MYFVFHAERIELVSHYRRLPLDVCNKMMIEILARPESREIHLKYLLQEVWNEKKLDISSSRVSFQQLIRQKSIRDTDLLDICLRFGLPLLKDDIDVAIKELPVKLCQFFKDLVNKLEYSQEELNSLCETAVNENKAPFVITFVQLGASLPSTCAQGNTIRDILLKTLKDKDIDGAKALIQKFTKPIASNLELSSLLASRIGDDPIMISMLLDAGLDPNGGDRKTPTPIAAVMNKGHLKLSKRAHIVCLLLEKGEDCSHLQQTSKSSTTPLHVATEIALKTGKKV